MPATKSQHAFYRLIKAQQILKARLYLTFTMQLKPCLSQNLHCDNMIKVATQEENIQRGFWL